MDFNFSLNCQEKLKPNKSKIQCYNKLVEFKSNPSKIEFLHDIVNDSYIHYIKWNTFCAFNSIEDIFYLTYSNEQKSIIFYNLIDNKKISEIKNAHAKHITNFRHYLDANNKRDLIISISLDDNNIKLWNVNYLVCLLNVEHANKVGGLLSACFLIDNNNINIVTSNHSISHIEPIKIYDLNGNIIQIINDSKNATDYIDTYYDNQNSNIYILACNDNFIKSFDYKQNLIYKTYEDINKYNNNKFYRKSHIYCIINDKEQLIESSQDNIIRIWNFHSAILLNKIIINQFFVLNGFCLWNNEYICISYEDETIKIVELKNGKIIKELKNHNKNVLYIEKIIHPIFGECLISQGWRNDCIKLWGNVND